jgi:hypothetical protein
MLVWSSYHLAQMVGAAACPTQRWCCCCCLMGFALPLPPLHMTGVLCADGSSWSADLVVDCSGRGSALPSWLAAAGFKRPHTSRVSAGTGYASWWVGRMMQLTAAARSVAGCGDGSSSSAAGCTGCLSFETSIEHVRKQPMPARVSSGWQL